MTVSFVSHYLDIAIELFNDTFTSNEEVVHSSITGHTVHFFFPDDTFIRDVRSWCADAFGCGLIFCPAIDVN